MVRQLAVSPPPYESGPESESDSGCDPGGNATYPGESIIVVGVDFGTTYSGVSYALSAQPDQIHIIQQWPGNGIETSEKVPSEISYNPSNKNQPRGLAWGFQVETDELRLKWFKLLLAMGEPHVNRIANLKLTIEEHNKSKPKNKEPVQVAEDYFSCLSASLKAEISKRYGAGFYSIFPKTFIFTVPAMWSDNAKALTQKAAKDAGFLGDDDEIRLVSEPEAAALYCLRKNQSHEIKQGSNIIVADCGGGTVDMIPYRVISLKPMMVAEIAVGEGDLCGSIYINASFEEFMKRKIGVSAFHSLSRKAKDAMMKGFEEEIKCRFSGDPTEQILSMRAPGLPNREDGTVEDGFLYLKREEIIYIFRPVLEQIMRLADRQRLSIEHSGGRLSVLLLVGGFGESPYLFRRFQEWASNHGNIQVIQPPNAWSAVVRGAVIRGLETEKGMVQERVSRRYYGVSHNTPFIPSIHPVKDKYWHAKRNKYYCQNRVNWFIEKGSEYSENTPLESNFCRELWMHEFDDKDEKIFTSKLLAYDGDSPPKNSDHPDIVQVGKIVSDLNNAPPGAWKKKNFGTNEDVMKVDYNLRMTLRGALLEFELRCLGEKFGSCNIVFDGHGCRR